MVNSIALERTVRCVRITNLLVIGLGTVSKANTAVILMWTVVTEVTKKIVVSDLRLAQLQLTWYENMNDNFH